MSLSRKKPGSPISRTANVERNGGHKWVKCSTHHQREQLVSCLLCFFYTGDVFFCDLDICTEVFLTRLLVTQKKKTLGSYAKQLMKVHIHDELFETIFLDTIIVIKCIKLTDTDLQNVTYTKYHRNKQMRSRQLIGQRNI